MVKVFNRTFLQVFPATMPPGRVAAFCNYASNLVANCERWSDLPPWVGDAPKTDMQDARAIDELSLAPVELDENNDNASSTATRTSTSTSTSGTSASGTSTSATSTESSSAQEAEAEEQDE